jgi:hypothetical protein
LAREIHKNAHFRWTGILHLGILTLVSGPEHGRVGLVMKDEAVCPFVWGGKIMLSSFGK